MKRLLFLLLLAILLPKESIGCFCVPPDLQTEVKRADVVFLGVVTEIYENPTLFSPRAPSFVGMSFANLKVIKSAKGLNTYVTTVSVFDEHFNSQCGRLFTNYSVGDTVLIAGSYLEGDHHFGFVISHNCRKNVLKRDFNKAETTFVNNDSLWVIAKELDSSIYAKEGYPVGRQIEKRPDNWFLLLGLVLSIAINVILAIQKIQRKSTAVFKPSEESELV